MAKKYPNMIKENLTYLAVKAKTHQKIILKYLQILLLVYIAFNLIGVRSDIDDIYGELSSLQSDISDAESQCSDAKSECRSTGDSCSKILYYR